MKDEQDRHKWNNS